MTKSSDLHKIWSAADNSRLIAKQFSLRLPVGVAAKIAALCDMFPQRTRTLIIGDLLASALIDLEVSLPSYPSNVTHQLPNGDEFVEHYGPGVRYRELAQKHFEEYERELGNDNPPDLFSVDYPMGRNHPD